MLGAIIYVKIHHKILTILEILAPLGFEMEKISVTIITKNEEKNIGRCLESLRWVDEIIVVDTNSDDRTVEINFYSSVVTVSIDHYDFIYPS